MKKIIFLYCIVFAVLTMQGQAWLEYLPSAKTKQDKTQHNFYELQKAFNAYWQGKTIQRSSGYKVFKRWEWFNEPRVYPSGELISPVHYQKEQQKRKETFKTSAGNWTSLGPTSWTTNSYNPGLGRINAIAVHPTNPNIIFIGTPSGGLWKSTNGGLTWANSGTDALTTRIGVSSIAIDQTNPSVMYIATGDADGWDTRSIGLLKSTDGGATWNTTGLTFGTGTNKRLSRVLIHPTNSNIILISGSDGVYRSTDAGATFTLTYSGMNVRDMEFKPTDPNIVYISGNQFWKSTNNGVSFTQITSGVPTGIGRIEIAVTPANPDYVYFIASKTSDDFHSLCRSTNSGTSFTTRSNTPNILGYSDTGGDSSGQAWYDLTLAVSPTNAEEVYAGGINLWKSTNGGSSWNIIAHWYYGSTHPYVHADQHFLAFFGTKLYAGCDGGIWVSSNYGTSWTDLSAGLPITQFYRLGGAPQNANLIAAGAQDNGCNLMNGTNWTHIQGADGMECIIDYINSNIIYTSSQGGGLNRSNNGGLSYTDITSGITESGAWVTPYVIHPSNPDILYAGFDNIWKTTNKGSSWTKISTFTGTSKIVDVRIAPSNPNYIYCIKGNTLYKTTNDGASWSNITAGLPTSVAQMTYIAVSNTNPDHVWVTFSGTSALNKVFKSTNGGATWTNVTSNLPNVPVNCIVYQSGMSDGLYVGTDIGVFYTDNTLSNWQDFSTGLPHVVITELEIHYGASKIRASTFGRGIWQSDLFSTPAAPPICDFSADKTTICPGDTIQFSDLSSYANPGWTWTFTGGTPVTSTTIANPKVVYNTVGTYTVSLTVSNTYGSDTETKTAYITVAYPSPVSLPFVESFESVTTFPPANWQNKGRWDLKTGVSAYSVGSKSMMFDNYNINASNEKDDIFTPYYMISVPGGVLTFDVAYARYGPTYSDTLAVYYSDNCGITKSLLYKKGGSTLATAPDNTSVFIPSSTQWRNESIALPVSTQPMSIIFQNIGGYGNMLYIDNINITTPTFLTDKPLAQHIKVYPNPAKNRVYMELPADRGTLMITNMFGQTVYQENIMQEILKTIDISSFAKGIYHIQYNTSKNRYYQKLVIE